MSDFHEDWPDDPWAEAEFQMNHRDEENECPNCGEYKKEEYDTCYDCAQLEEAERLEFKYVSKVRETDGAVLLKLKPGFTGRSVWVPKSLLELDEGDCTFTVPQWFAEKEGIE